MWPLESMQMIDFKGLKRSQLSSSQMNSEARAAKIKSQLQSNIVLLTRPVCSVKTHRAGLQLSSPELWYNLIVLKGCVLTPWEKVYIEVCLL